MKSGSSRSFQKAFGSADVLALAFGSMIGWGWVMLCGKWASQGGMIGAMLAFAAGAVLCIFVGLTYAELTPAVMEPGGNVAFSRLAMGPLAALFSGLATSLAYLGVAAWEGPALISAVGYLVEVPRAGMLWQIQGVDVYLSETLFAILGTAALVWINIRGTKATAVFQTVATVGILLVGLLFLSGGVLFGKLENTGPMFTSVSGFMSVLLVVPAMFVGFDVIPQAAGEMSVPRKRIPRLLILSIIAASVWYILMILATCLSAPTDVREAGVIPVADSMAYAFGHPLWGQVCIIGALCGIVTSWNGFLFGSARCIYSMACAGMLPKALARTHQKYGTPYVAILFCGALCAAAAFLGAGALSWFANAASFGAVVMYLTVVLSFIVLRVRQPNLARPYKIRHARAIGVLALIVVCFFIYLYLPVGPSSLAGEEWTIVLGWFGLGILLFFIRKGMGTK